MKKTLQTIETAIRDLYRLDVPQSVNDFIMSPRGIDPDLLPQGTLLVHEEEKDLSVGVYFHPKIQSTLESSEIQNLDQWTAEETNAFATAAEEISHFLYLIFQTHQGRPVSQFELELQGEIDKFLLLFFRDSTQKGEEKFESLYKTVFENFSWSPLVSEAERERYESANSFAKKFISSVKNPLCDRRNHPELMRLLRHYYRLGSSEKIGFLLKD